MLSCRLLSAGLIVAAAALSPCVAFAQDAAAMDNSSPTIGLLVIWLLGVGGVLSVIAGISIDKSVQASRTRR